MSGKKVRGEGHPKDINMKRLFDWFLNKCICKIKQYILIFAMKLMGISETVLLNSQVYITLILIL